MDSGRERNRPWTADEKERFLDRIGGYELSPGEMDESEILNFLNEEVGDERP